MLSYLSSLRNLLISLLSPGAITPIAALLDTDTATRVPGIQVPGSFLFIGAGIDTLSTATYVFIHLFLLIFQMCWRSNQKPTKEWFLTKHRRGWRELDQCCQPEIVNYSSRF
jgi:hypothetical protein